MKESIGEQVAREIRMLDMAQKILKEVTKIASKSSADVRAGGLGEGGRREWADNGPVGDAQPKPELKNRRQGSIFVLIRQQDTKGDCPWRRQVIFTTRWD